MSDNSHTIQERMISLEDIKRQLQTLLDKREWSYEKAEEEIKLSRKTIGRFLSSKSEEGKFADNTIKKVVTFLRANPPMGGFYGREMYLNIAAGMGAATKNAEFAKQYSGKYCVLRAHVPSTRPLMSRLEIFADDPSDGTVIRYKHYHQVSDALSLLRAQEKTFDEGSGKGEAIEYEGFVFVCNNRAFFLSTAKDTEHIKEMIVNLRRGRSASDVTMRGLLLTLSADDREPFASRVLLQRMSDARLKQKAWSPGLKESWDRFRPFPEIMQVFDESDNFGLLRMRV